MALTLSGNKNRTHSQNLKQHHGILRSLRLYRIISSSDFTEITHYRQNVSNMSQLMQKSQSAAFNVTA